MNNELKLLTINKEDSLLIDNCDHYLLSRFKHNNKIKKTEKKQYKQLKELIFDSNLFPNSFLIQEDKRYKRKNQTLKMINDDNCRFILNPTFLKTQKPIRLQTNFDIIEKNLDGTHNIYIIKPSNSLKESYIRELGFSKIVTEFSNLSVKNCYLIHLNPDYRLSDKLDIKKLITIKDLTADVNKEVNLIKQNIVNQYNSIIKDETKIFNLKNEKCQKCPQIEFCWKNISDDSLLYLRKISDSKLKNMKENDKFNISQLNESDLYELSSTQERQAISYKSNDIYFHSDEIESIISSISENHCFLKFQNKLKLIPEIEGEKPNQSSIFSFLLKSNILINYKKIDPSYEESLISELVSQLEMYDSIIVYNGIQEKTSLNNYRIKYPSLSERIQKILNKIVDLYSLVNNLSVYHHKMKNDISLNSLSKHILNIPFVSNPEKNLYEINEVNSLKNGLEFVDTISIFLNFLKKELNRKKKVA